jgi:hypothetical protein
MRVVLFWLSLSSDLRAYLLPFREQGQGPGL